MKKLLVFGLALILVAAYTLPAAALENKFGGFAEFNFNSYGKLDYVDEGTTGDWSGARQRTRLYYTAIFSDKFRFVNQFELDSVFGQYGGPAADQSNRGFGDLGADGIAVEVKRTYVDFELAQLRFEIGAQGFQLHRGLVIDDDASGIKFSWRGSQKTFIPALWWWRLYDGDVGTNRPSSTGIAQNHGADVDHYVALVNIKVGDMQFVPTVSYLTANSGNKYAPMSTAKEAMKIYFAGLDFNMKADKLDLEATGVYEGGSLNDSVDISAYALWGKVGFQLGNINLHVAALYTTGEEATPSGDYDGFWYPQQNGTGASFKTSELVRKGDDWTMLTRYENGSSPENRMEFGAGVDFAAAKNLMLYFNFWNLNLAEDAASGDSDVGNEIDLKATIGLMKSLDLDLIGAYLIVGDAYKPAVNASDYAYEASARLRLSF